jgi:hypothetical protein
MSYVEAATSREQKFASDRRHALEHRNFEPGPRQNFSGHKSRRTGADHCNGAHIRNCDS